MNEITRLRNKADYFQLAERSCLGNTLRNWRSLDSALSSGVETFGVRQIGIGGGGFHYVVPRAELSPLISRLEKEMGPYSLGTSYIIDEAAPDYDVVLQGEVCRTFRGWEGFLGLHTGVRMREAVKRKLLLPLNGLAVRDLLNRYLDPSSRDDLDSLLDLYPNATVEFATFPYTLGKLPERNTVIWEVRNY